MISLGILTLAAGGLLAQVDPCTIDRQQAIALSEEAFDQGEAGWRSLARPGCFIAAAQLIADYRTTHSQHGKMLFFHEAQMRAAGGDYPTAAPLFEAARSGPNEWRVDTGWNDYVAASAAFVRRDKAALQAHRDRLAALPPPPLQPQVADAARNEPVPEGWPYNLDVVDSLIRCFDRPYAEAMTACRS